MFDEWENANDDARLSLWWAPKLLDASKVFDGDMRYASPYPLQTQFTVDYTDKFLPAVK
jgi:hypothetical protein